MATDAEINEEVARKLGWKIIDDPVMGKAHVRPASGIPVFANEPPASMDYCHSIAAAWEMAEKCESIVLAHGLDRETLRLRWSCVMNNVVCCIADTAPMAICLTFLKLP